MRTKDLRNVSIPEEDWRLLRMEALKLGTTASQILRGLLASYLRPEEHVSEEAKALAYQKAWGRSLAQSRTTEGPSAPPEPSQGP